MTDQTSASNRVVHGPGEYPLGEYPREMNITGISGDGRADTLIVAGIVYGNVGDVSGDYVQELEGKTRHDISIWTKGMVRVSAVDTILEKFSSGQSWVTITGCPGEGKTTLGYLTLKQLKDQGTRVIRVDYPKDFDHVVKRVENCVIMLNDIFGSFTFNILQLKEWEKVLYDVIDGLKKDRESRKKVIFINRKNVMEVAKNHLGVYAENIYAEVQTINLTQSENERLQILNFHLNKNGISVPEDVKQRVATRSSVHGFPHCCEVYADLISKHAKDVNIEKFFESPLKFLNYTTTVLAEKNTCLTFFRTMLAYEGMLNVMAIPGEKLRNTLQLAVDELVNSYVIETESEVTFSHPSIFESVVQVLAKRDPVYFVQHATVSFLLQTVSLVESDTECLIQLSTNSAVIDELVKRFRPYILKTNFFMFRIGRLFSHDDFCRKIVDSCFRRTWILFFLKGIYINARDELGYTTLYHAVEGGVYTAVDMLVRKGACVKTLVGDYILPITEAEHAYYIHKNRQARETEIMKLLLTRGADVNTAGNNGRTALTILASRGWTRQNQSNLNSRISF